MQSSLIIVANRLPVSVHQTTDGLAFRPSPGGMAAALSPILAEPSTQWVGYTGVGRRLSKAELVQLNLPKQLVPVNVGQELYRRYYYNFANGSIWPSLHGFTPKRMYDEADWEAVLAVTTQFAEEVMATAAPDDLIWVHDFQLIMLPLILRSMGCKNRIGYFLHIPFAGTEYFEALPHHERMLESLAATDLCGFQTKQDLVRFRHYLSKMAKARGFKPALGVFPVGIGYDHYEAAHRQPKIEKAARDLDQALAGKTVIFSISRLDYTKGIIEQLEGVEEFLAGRPDREQMVYKLVVAPSREDLVEYSDLKQAIARKVDEVNARLGTDSWQPVDYDYRNYDFDELASWYCRADIMLVTPLIDGMNLIAKEYVATKASDDGVLILSQAAGAALQLEEALLVDVKRSGAIAKALQRAVMMPAAERSQRHKAMRQNVRLEDAVTWVHRFAEALAAVPHSGPRD